ncbi:hypothetical protein SprV_0301322300 [Sparganum proliferum]
MTKNSPANALEGQLKEQQLTERYTFEELEFLFTAVRCYPYIVESPLTNAETKRRKTVIWNWITGVVHDKFKQTTGKSPIQLRNWWKRTKNRAKKRLEHTELDISETQSGLPNRNRGYLEHIFKDICEFSNQINKLYSPELEDLDFKKFLTTHNAHDRGTRVDLVNDSPEEVETIGTGAEYESAAETEGFQVIDNSKRQLEMGQGVGDGSGFLCGHEINHTHFGLLDFTRQTEFQQMVVTAFWKLVSTLNPATAMSGTEDAGLNSRDLLTNTLREEGRESLFKPQILGPVLKEQMQTPLTSLSIGSSETRGLAENAADNCSNISSHHVPAKNAPQGSRHGETRMDEDVDRLKEQVYLLKRRKLELEIKLLEKQLS